MPAAPPSRLVVPCLIALALAFAAPAAAQVPEDSLPYHEWGAPSGAFEGKPPRGYVLVVHGGAWLNVGADLVAAARYKADEFRARGWATLNTTYKPGAASVDDLTRSARFLRERAGPDAPVCLWGGSAGGQLVLLAAARGAYDCVITEAGPTDLVSVQHQLANGSILGPVAGYLRAVLVFGLDKLWQNSPVRVAREIHGRLLMATAATDSYVPLDQMDEMQAARPQTRTLVLDGGSPSDPLFVHAFITPAAQARLQAAIGETLAGARRDVLGRVAARDLSVRLRPRVRGAWFATRLPVAVDASAGVERVVLRVGGRVVATDRSAPFRFSYHPPGSLTDGRHRLSVTAFAGGRSLRARTTVRRVPAAALRRHCRHRRCAGA
jgi:hypothetical protein